METQTTTPQTPADRAGTVGHETKQAAGDVAATAGQEAKQVTREAKDQVRQLWGQTRRDLTDQAATQQTRVAGSLRELADQLGSMAGAADQDGMAVGLVDDVARRAGDAATWLDQRDPGSLLEEARSFARQRPGTFLAIAAGVGVLAGRLSRSLVDEARDSDDSPRTGSTRAGQFGDTNGSATRTGYGTTTGGAYGTGSLGATGSTAGTGMPAGEQPRRHPPPRRRRSRPVRLPRPWARATPPSPAAGFPTRTRSTQPIAPDGTPSPIDDEGNLTAEGDDPCEEPMTEQQRLRTPGPTVGSDTRNDLPDPSLRSVGEVLGDITTDLSTLLRQEVELAKAELKETADHAKAAGGMFAGAGVAAHLALIFLSLAVWWALGDALDSLGWSALIVGLLWALAAGVMAAMGRTRMKRVTPLAPRTVDTTKDIPEALKGHETR